MQQHYTITNIKTSNQPTCEWPISKTCWNDDSLRLYVVDNGWQIIPTPFMETITPETTILYSEMWVIARPRGTAHIGKPNIIVIVK